MNQMKGEDPQEIEDADKEFKFYARKIVMKAFAPIRQAVVRNRFLSINGQMIHVLRSIPASINLDEYGITKDDWKASVKRTIADIKQSKMTLSNISPYLYLYDKMTGHKG